MAAGGNPPQDSLNSARTDINTFHGPRAMRKSIAGTAADTIQSLSVLVLALSALQARLLRNSSLFSKRKSCMDSTFEPDEIKRAKLHPVKCSKCKANLMIRPTEKVCPVCGGSLPKPGKR